MEPDRPPVLRAVSSSARQLFLLLRCVGFSPKADVQITSEGLRLSVEESRAVQGLVFLDNNLFSSYNFDSASFCDTANAVADETTSAPSFQIDLSALLETLQIFGLPDATYVASRNSSGGFNTPYTHEAFNTPALAVQGGTCRITYAYVGAPLSITISEAGVTTTCDLNTYGLTHEAGLDVDEAIPLQRDSLTLKIIMRSAWLYDAVNELACTSPTIFSLTASPHRRPIFAVEGIGGPFGDSVIDFQPNTLQANSHPEANSLSTSSGASGSLKGRTPLISETFTVQPAPGTGGRVRQRYKFEHIQKAARAMDLASKVCLRCDRQGVLSLQFMVEISGDDSKTSNSDRGVITRRQMAQPGPTRSSRLVSNGAAPSADGSGGGKTSFIDFRLVPLVDEDEEDEGETETEDYGDGDGEETREDGD